MATGPRFLVTYEAAANAGSPTSALARDVALGGLFIETKAPLAIGALLSVELSSPRATATLEARVFSTRAKSEGPDKPAGMAVRFLDLPAAMLVKLQAVLDHHRPPARTRLGVGDDTEALWASAGGRDESLPDDDSLLLAASVQVEGRMTPDKPLLEPPPNVQPEEPRHPTPRMQEAAPPAPTAAASTPPPAIAPSVPPPSSTGAWTTASTRPGPPYVPPTPSGRPPALMKARTNTTLIVGIVIGVILLLILVAAVVLWQPAD